MMFSTRFSVLAGSFLVLYMLIGSRTCDAHKDGAYMRNEDDGFNPRLNWMGNLKDSVQLSELAIPGTDNSAGYKKLSSAEDIASGFFKSISEDVNNQNPIASLNQLGDIIKVDMQSTQVLTIRQQLQYGIRFFEVSVLFSKNQFGLIHKHHDTFLDLMFNDFLTQLANFLGENPSESILFSLKIKSEVGESSKTPKVLLQEYLQDANIAKYYLKTNNPRVTLGEARGKFVIVSKDINFNDFGLNGNGGDFVTMDTEYLSTNWDLHDKKWMPAKRALKDARTGDNNKFYIDYLSGYGGSFPYFVASGHSSPWTSAPRLSTGLTTPGWKNSYPDFPRTTCFIGICTISFEGTNILARDVIQGYNKDIGNQQRSVGIVLADFPGDNLIETIINNNGKLKK